MPGLIAAWFGLVLAFVASVFWVVAAAVGQTTQRRPAQDGFVIWESDARAMIQANDNARLDRLARFGTLTKAAIWATTVATVLLGLALFLLLHR